MDPLNTAMAFGQIISLISDFKSSRKSASDDEYQDFAEWLCKKRHDSVIKELSENNLLTRSVRQFLNSNHSEVVEKLNKLDSILLDIASRMSGLSEIANAIAPNLNLSDQAIDILTRFTKSNGRILCDPGYISNPGGKLIVLNGGKANIEISDPRFLEDDMKSLCQHGLLIADINSQGRQIWRITRAAVEFIKLNKY